jgi:hypothetical protein
MRHPAIALAIAASAAIASPAQAADLLYGGTYEERVVVAPVPPAPIYAPVVRERIVVPAPVYSAPVVRERIVAPAPRVVIQREVVVEPEVIVRPRVYAAPPFYAAPPVYDDLPVYAGPRVIAEPPVVAYGPVPTRRYRAVTPSYFD